MNEIIQPNQLSIEEHVQRIKDSLERTRQSIFETVLTIKECRDQLGPEVFQKDVSTMLGMSPSTLNRWISIGNSEFILEHQSELPSTFSSLYYLTQLEKKYVEYYPKDSHQKLSGLIEKGEISLTSQGSDIGEILKKIDDKIKLRKKKQREKNILSLGDGVVVDETTTSTIGELITQNRKFRSFIVTPSKKILSKWGDDGVSEIDILMEYPLHELRTPSISGVVTCLVVVPMKSIDVGLKILTSFGFRYRDTYTPPNSSSKLQRLSNEMIVVRGERGFSGNPPSDEISSSKTKDLVRWVSSNLPSPYCLVFGETEEENWVCLTE